MTHVTPTIPSALALALALAAARAQAQAPAVVKVDAKKAATAVTLAEGRSVEVSASGSWAIDNRNLYGKFDANGSTNGKPTEACALVPTAKMGALVGSLDGKTWFNVGAGPTLVKGPGTLQLAANDCTGGDKWPYYGDNAGTLDVKLGTSATVDAKKDNAFFTLAAGQGVVVAASGKWSIDNRNLYGSFDANGSTNGKPTEPCALVPGAKMGALVGSLDGKVWTALGAGPTTLTGPGTLHLAPNDCTGGEKWPYFGDNGGTLEVKFAPAP